MGVLSQTHEWRLVIIANHRNLYLICTSHVATPPVTQVIRRMRATQWQVPHPRSLPLSVTTRDRAHSLSTKPRSVDAKVSAASRDLQELLQSPNVISRTVVIQPVRAHRTLSANSLYLIARQRNVLRPRNTPCRNPCPRYHTPRQPTTSTLSTRLVSQRPNITSRKQHLDNEHLRRHKANQPAGLPERMLPHTPSTISKAIPSHRETTMPKVRGCRHHHLFTPDYLKWRSTL